MKQVSRPANLLHDPLINARVLIESFGDWHVLGADRRHPAYDGFFKRGETPIQLLYSPASTDNACGIRGAVSSVLAQNPHSISIITPCRATDGRFEIVIGNREPIRKCCFKCVSQFLQRGAGVTPPGHNEWIVYMLLECYSYMKGPALKEQGK